MWKKFFNNETAHGRANIAKVTYATITVLYVVYRFRKSIRKSEIMKNTNLFMSSNGNNLEIQDKFQNNVPPTIRSPTTLQKNSSDLHQSIVPNGFRYNNNIDHSSKCQCETSTPSQPAPPPSPLLRQQQEQQQSSTSSTSSTLSSPSTTITPSKNDHLIQRKRQKCLSEERQLPPPLTEREKIVRAKAETARLRAETAIAESEAAQFEAEELAKTEAEAEAEADAAGKLSTTVTKFRSLFGRGGKKNDAKKKPCPCAEKKAKDRAERIAAASRKTKRIIPTIKSRPTYPPPLPGKASLEEKTEKVDPFGKDENDQHFEKYCQESEKNQYEESQYYYEQQQLEQQQQVEQQQQQVEQQQEQQLEQQQQCPCRSDSNYNDIYHPPNQQEIQIDNYEQNLTEDNNYNQENSSCITNTTNECSEINEIDVN